MLYAYCIYSCDSLFFVFRYCIAWYPIYRIPDGSFHAAFLTYHSLGHFVHRSSPESGHGLSEDVVSPVVGLQTYNHKVHLLQVFFHNFHIFPLTFPDISAIVAVGCINNRKQINQKLTSGLKFLYQKDTDSIA